MLNAYAPGTKATFPGTLATMKQVPTEWKIFTCLDLAQDYFHITICGISQKLLAFEVGGLRYKYQCLPKGWTACAIAFHYRMLQALEGTRVIVYVDDVLVGGGTQTKHDYKLCKDLSRLESINIHINSCKL